MHSVSWPLFPLQVVSAHPSPDDAEASPDEGQTMSSVAGGVGGPPLVLPAPIIEPVLPARTRLQEAGAEVAVYYSQLEGQVNCRLFVSR